MTALIDLHFFPNIEYFTVIAHCDKLYIEKFENFQKQSYRNRCYIKTAQKIDRLSVPILGANKGKPLRKVKIDNTTHWAIKHWRSIHSAYGRSPYFEYYENQIKDVLCKGYDTLFELNYALLKCIIKLIGLKTTLEPTTSYNKNTDNELLDLRNKISLKNSSTIVNEVSYIQVFGNSFDGNLSILDLLFCEGPNTISILKSQNSELFIH
ncbi:WbqC family protein [Flammeovirga kamogawensis]|uniref:WbqC family protein n=1 Tax=Flammeovirga kamogawensis TaxID=373891 RepID=A0ABX8GRD4_9BACT|nr:WbqC family protein [Flammeovirga kamogawensis]MBB6463172.1 hypothetical protein [Flammeovirga kamogawensis]QWG05974.1 WbqC family protein [Flammeovirga kamogawensis]TRX67801.1 WbqC family protein [Flammeovirga kamogawensis]